ncbi:MAG TPA: adenylate/guanylate cyclase domain-containing protein [Deltaproteobacteria bacterium]|nr:adenylate/guanylate cyclase domain-containing protein [Deltaproteobacteria bacterium]|tara:strand:- start:1744 stop:3093 length:1350 start_codon:yes stop_codon:yes gene_type:complete
MDFETEYAYKGDTSLAYQVFGNASEDLIIVPGIISHVEYFHEIDGYSDFINLLTKYYRVIVFDKRGNGLSERIHHAPTLAERMEDIEIIVDAASAKNPTLIGFSEGASLIVMYAAMNPEKVKNIILIGGFAKGISDDSTGLFFPDSPLVLNLKETITSTWGSGMFGAITLPVGQKPSDRQLKIFAKLERLSNSPMGMVKLCEINFGLDITKYLKSVQCPTLVFHCKHDALVPVEAGKYLAKNIPGAEYVELENVGHNFFLNDTELALEKIFSFTKIDHHHDETHIERVLATVLFNDIVDSTKNQVKLGDRKWKYFTEKINVETMDYVTKHRGQFIKSTGDGILATFNSPSSAIQCAFKINNYVNDLPGVNLSLRSGLHMGEIEILGDDISGISVNLAARIQAAAESDEILVSSMLENLVFGSSIAFEPKGQFKFKGFEKEFSVSRVLKV